MQDRIGCALEREALLIRIRCIMREPLTTFEGTCHLDEVTHPKAMHLITGFAVSDMKDVCRQPAMHDMSCIAPGPTGSCLNLLRV